MASTIDDVSTDPSGKTLPFSADPAISADGSIVVFDSDNLHPLPIYTLGDFNVDYAPYQSTYAKNVVTGDLTLVSAASDGTPFGRLTGIIHSGLVSVA